GGARDLRVVRAHPAALLVGDARDARRRTVGRAAAALDVELAHDRPVVAARADAVVRALRVGGAREARRVRADAGGEARTAAQVHGVPNGRAELREVPAAAVEATLRVTADAGDVRGVVRGADHRADRLEGVRIVEVEARRGVGEP